MNHRSRRIICCMGTLLCAAMAIPENLSAGVIIDSVSSSSRAAVSLSNSQRLLREDSDSSTGRFGNLESAVAPAGVDIAGTPFTSLVAVAGKWWISPDGTQGFQTESHSSSYTSSGATSLAGVFLVTSFDFNYSFTVDVATTYHFQRTSQFNGISAPVIGGAVGMSAGQSRGGNLGSATFLQSFAPDNNITHSVENIFGIGNGLPGSLASPWQPTATGAINTVPALITGVVTDNVDEDDIPIERSGDIAGIDLTTSFVTPVVGGGYGQNETVYFDPELAAGYGYFIEDGNRFKSFEIPEALLQGDDPFSIHHLGMAYPLLAGLTFDFTTIDPLGVDSFLLLGIDESELIDPLSNSHPPFVFGATFAQPGLAEFSTFALTLASDPSTVVPEPSSLVLAMIGFVSCLLLSRRRFGR